MKKFVSIFFILSCCIGSTGLCFAQPRELYPVIGVKPDLSEDAQKRFARRNELIDMGSDRLTEEEDEELQTLCMEFSEAHEEIWDILGGGCSWYCGGGPYKVTSSSHLKAQGGIEYIPENAADLSFKTVWAEGVKGYGEGEYIEYYFDNASPRLHTVIIHNGYVRTEQLWRNNSRVKALDMTVNGEHYATLHLEDTPVAQSFSVGLLGRREDGEDLVLRFTITDVYPGDKYEDTVLTQIYFDGIDVH